MANEASAWLTKLEKLTPEQRQAIGWSDEDFAAAKKEHMLERDYTPRSQKLAALQQLADQYPNLAPADVVKVYDWYQANAPVVKDALALYNRRDQLVEKPQRAEGYDPKAPKKWRDLDPADLYDRATALGILEDLHKDASETAYARWQKDYQDKEIPRLNGVVDGVTNTVLDLVGFAIEDGLRSVKDEKHARIGIRDVMTQAAVRGERDFAKVAQSMREERARDLRPIEEDAYKRGLEEGKKTAEGPSGPLGGARPGWRPDVPDPAPKTREDRFARVVSAVEAKHGRPLAI